MLSCIRTVTVYFVLFSGSIDTVFGQTVPPTERLTPTMMPQDASSDVHPTHTMIQPSPTSMTQDFSPEIAPASSSVFISTANEPTTTSGVSQSAVPTITPSMTGMLGTSSGSLVEVSASSGSQQIFKHNVTSHTVLPSPSDKISQSVSAEETQAIQPPMSSQQEEISVSYLGPLPFSSQVTLERFSTQQDTTKSMYFQSGIFPTSTSYSSVPILPSGMTDMSSPYAPVEPTQVSKAIMSASVSSGSESSKTVDEKDTTPAKKPVSKDSNDNGLSSGGKAAVGIVVTVLILGLIIGGIVLYRRHNFTHRSLKSFLTSGVRYKTYNNATYKDDEGMLIMPDRR